MLGLIKGERYKIKKGVMSKFMLLIYIFAGIIYFMQCRTTLLTSDISELAEDETIKVLTLMLGDLIHYGNQAKSTIIVFGNFTVFGLLSALLIVPLFTSIFVADEFSTRSMQQLICKGVSRYKIVLAKFFGICECNILINACMIGVGTIVTIISTGQGNLNLFITQMIVYFLKLVLLNIAFIAVCMFCAFGIKYCGAAMPVNFIVLICLLDKLADGLLSTYVWLPMITYITISLIFVGGTIFLFYKSDIK